MPATTRQTLIRQPNYTLELVKSFDAEGSPCHAFTLFPTAGIADEMEHERQGIVLLTGAGHEAGRKDMHYALYLFQRFHVQNMATSSRMMA